MDGTPRWLLARHLDSRKVPKQRFSLCLKLTGSNWLREFGTVFWDPVLRAFTSGICVFSGRKGVSPERQIGQIFSVCLSVCHTFFFGHFFNHVDRDTTRKYSKITQKEASGARWGTELDHFWDPPQSTSGFSSALAFSSSCACGAT